MISIGIRNDSFYSATIAASKPSHEAIHPVPIPVDISHEAIHPVPIPVDISHEAIYPADIAAYEISHEAIQPGYGTGLQKDQESQKNRFGDILNETMKTASASSPRGQALVSPYPIGVSCFDLSSLLT